MIWQKAFAIALLILLAATAPAAAHPLGFSGCQLLIWQDKAMVIYTLHTRDMSQWFPPLKFPDYVNDVCREIVKDPADLAELDLDGRVVAAAGKRAFAPEEGMIQVELTYPISAMPHAITIWSKHLVRLPVDHQQLVFAQDMRGDPTVQIGMPIGDGVLSREAPSLTVEIPKTPRTSLAATTAPTAAPTAAPATPRISFFLLGIEHIVTGYDHLLFLAALLLVCRSFRQAAAVITFFTVAHSITLTLAALDIVRLPAHLVEPAIAASIIYVGIENIVGKHRFLWRALITFAFGLVHGLGFASALREVGLGSTSLGVAVPLLKFSIGLETGQLAIALVMLKLMMSAKKHPQFERRWAPACSLLVSLIGAYWLIERVAGG